MSTSEKRLAMLEKITQNGSKDPFAWYGLALEYKGAGRVDDALSTFTTLRATSPDYVPMYLMCGQMLVAAARTEAAREWFEAGIAAARAKRDGHALSELEGALAAL